MPELTQVYWDNLSDTNYITTSKTHIIKGSNDRALCGVKVPAWCDAGYDGGTSACKTCAKIADKIT